MTLKIGWLHEAEHCLGTWLHEADDWHFVPDFREAKCVHAEWNALVRGFQVATDDFDEALDRDVPGHLASEIEELNELWFELGDGLAIAVDSGRDLADPSELT
jgi:hypothetical protein